MTDREAVALLPCPFCGSGSHVIENHGSYIECMECGATSGNSEWNTRAAISAMGSGVSIEQAAQVLLDAIPQRRSIAERVHQNTDASSVGTIELALMYALKDLGYPTPPQGEGV